MRLSLSILALFLTSLLHGTADEVVWPLPPPPAGTPYQQFAAPQADTNFLEHIRLARSQRTDMILDGDSITDYWQTTGRPVFDQVFAPRHAIDFGMSGNQTQNVLWRLDHGELDMLHPKLAMLLIGTNNLGGPVDDIVAGITMIVQTYRRKCPDMHILLLGIFPHGHLTDNAERPKIKQINALISKLDDGAHVTFLDIGDKFLEPDGTMSPEVMGDFLHPALKGYQIWADAVQPMLDKYCPVDPPGTPVAPPPKLSTAEVAATVPTQSWPYAVEAPAGTPGPIFPMYYINWFHIFQEHLGWLKSGPYDLVLDGDSIVADGESKIRPAIQARYGDVKMLDLGIYGDHVQNVLWRVRHGDLDSQDPKLIVLLIGASHIGEDVKDVTGGTKLVLDEYKKRCPHAHILLLGLLPRLPDADTRAWIEKLNTQYATLADDRVTYLDIGAKFRQPDGTVPADLFHDGLNPSDKGYALWTEAILPVIDKCIPPATKH